MTRPRSLLDIQREFPDEAACGEYIISHRWPNGFVCPRCGSQRGVRLRTRAFTFECLACHRQTSATAGTLLHRTKLPLNVWFWAAHLFSTHSNSMSALQLKDQLGVNFRTAWLLLHKLRTAVADRDSEMLTGLVEIDQAFIPFRANPNNPAAPPGGEIIIVAAVELVDRHTGMVPPTNFNRPYLNVMPQRLRLGVLSDESHVPLHAFVRNNIQPGSTLLTDGHDAFIGLSDPRDPNRYVRDARVVGNMAGHVVLPATHRVFALLKRWGLGTFHGFRPHHFDLFLEEYAFRFNRRYWRRVSFDRLLGFSIVHPPHSYADVVGRTPRPNRRNPPLRVRPRNRKTPTGFQQDPTPDPRPAATQDLVVPGTPA